ncbi:MAG: hypothetical protein RR472_04740 [Anaerovoracaceae bacterium]
MKLTMEKITVCLRRNSTCPARFPELKFIPKTGGQTTIKIGPNEGINYGDLSTNLKDALVDSNPLTRGIYLDRDKNGAPLLVVVLDTTYSSYSISERYPNIAMGSFTASITGSLAGGKPATVASNVAHSYFESEATKDGITTYEIKSLRHLNNVRYANKKEAAGKVGYVQSGDVFGRDCFGDPLQFKPIGGNEGFTGKYVGIQDKKAHTIYDLTIAGGEGEDYVGLFGQVNEGAVVEGITMSYTDSYRQQAKTDTDPENQKKYFINGQKMTGMICGSNKGIIRNCSVSGKVNLRSSVAGVFAVGGIAGTNGWDGLSDAAPSGIGRIEGCYSAASVYADTSQAELSLVGGIAGGSKGIIAYCEVGTALGENKANEQMNLIGLPYSGANGTRDSGGKASYRYPAECKNDQVVITAGDKPAAVGGIVGGLSRFAEKDNKNPSNIMYCINGATVVATGETGEVSCGGLVGKTAGTEAVRLLCSVNAGKVVGGPTAVNGSIGGAVGYLSKNGEVSGTYNTGKLSGYALAGIAGGESKGLIESCYNIGSLENNLREHCYGIAKSGEVYSCAYLLNGQTFAPDPGWGDILPCEKDRDLQGFNFGGGWFNKAQNGGTGPFAYIYPTIKENNGNQGEYKPNYSIGSDFHRTPWGQAE